MMDASPETVSDAHRRRASRILLVGLGALLVVGVLIVRDFGEGVDEWHNAFYGWAFLHAYEDGHFLSNPDIQYFNGPLFMMIWVAASQALHGLISAWSVIDGHHLTVFLTFVAGLWFFYRLCCRFVSPGPALVTTSLFALQPLVFGHAFINQKDTPLMVFFLASVTLGWEAVDRLRPGAAGEPRPSAVVPEWRRFPPGARVLIAIAAAVLLGLVLDLWLFGGTLKAAHAVVEAAYGGRSFGWVNDLFARVATDAYKTPVGLYLAKVDRGAFWLRFPATAVLFIALRWGIGRVLPIWTAARLCLWERRWGLLVLAGAAVGATTSIRLVGPLAGVLVVMLMLARLGRSAMVPLFVYGVAAILTTYLTWPVLWGHPVQSFLSHAGEASGFSSFNVLFAGHLYESTNLPWSYLPWLLAIQLTLPAVAAIVGGLGWAVWKIVKAPEGRVELLIILSWAVVPAGAIMLGVVPVYNNFRHALFMLPALFVLAGLGPAWAARIRMPILVRGGLIAVMLLPGVVGIVSLHPYEYIYYNALVGGMDGAAGQYEMDYWCTSFREAMLYVNQVAPENARVAVAGSLTTATPYARPGLRLNLDRSGHSMPDYGLACGPNQDKGDYLPNYATVFRVQRGRAVLSVVKTP